jgi:hypothetical protein
VRLKQDRSRTRRRPIGRDYAAAKDAEVGKKARNGNLIFFYPKPCALLALLNISQSSSEVNLTGAP